MDIRFRSDRSICRTMRRLIAAGTTHAERSDQRNSDRCPGIRARIVRGRRGATIRWQRPTNEPGGGRSIGGGRTRGNILGAISGQRRAKDALDVLLRGENRATLLVNGRLMWQTFPDRNGLMQLEHIGRCCDVRRGDKVGLTIRGRQVCCMLKGNRPLTYVFLRWPSRDRYSRRGAPTLTGHARTPWPLHWRHRARRVRGNSGGIGAASALPQSARI